MHSTLPAKNGAERKAAGPQAEREIRSISASRSRQLYGKRGDDVGFDTLTLKNVEIGQLAIGSDDAVTSAIYGMAKNM